MNFSTSKPLPTLEGMPPEIMTIIMNSTDSGLSGKTKKHVFSAVDAGNVRLVSRRVHDTMLDSFSSRFFTARKHMISRFSLKALTAISLHPTFGGCIREVAIGIESVNPEFPEWIMATCDSVAHNSARDTWESKFGTVYQAMVTDQEHFEISGDAVSVLGAIFRRFPRLRNVRIDSYPEVLKDHEASDEARTDGWGIQTVLRKMGYYEIPKCDRPYRRYVLQREYPQLRHCGVVLEALLSISDHSGWTLDMNLRTLGLYMIEGNQPFDLGSRLWQENCKRVRAINLQDSVGTTRDKYLDKVWVQQLLHSCDSLQTLRAKNEYQWHRIFRAQAWPCLKTLSIQGGHIQDLFFQEFLQRQTDTLETIVCKDCRLSALWDPNLDLLSPDYETKDPCWFQKLEIMADMPQLRKVILSNITQDHFVDDLRNHQEDRTGQKGSLEIVLSKNEIPRRLLSITTERCTESSFHAHNGSRSGIHVSIWFPEVSAATVEA